jgi:hypothetical protein
MPAPEVIRVDADGVMYFEHPLGALLDYSINLVDDPSGSALGSALYAASGVTITPAGAMIVGNASTAYTPPTPPGGGAVTPAAPAENAGVVTFWLWAASGGAAPAVGDEIDVEVWYRTSGPARVTRAKLRIRIT